MSVCLGLDVLEEEFISDAVELNSKYSIDQHRHHPDEDRDYYVLFDLDKSGALQIKLIPLITRSHCCITRGRGAQDAQLNELARQRYYHLYQLMWIPYDAAKPDSYYKKLIRDEFDTQTYTFQGVEKKLWGNVDGFFERYFEGWLMVKKEGIDAFFKSKKKDANGDTIGYPNFYKGVVKPLRWQYIMFLEGDPHCEDPAFWFWFFNDYSRKNVYPIHFFPFEDDS